MELLLTGAIVSLGAMFSQDTKEKDDKKKFFAKVPLNKKPNGENIYQSNQSRDTQECIINTMMGDPELAANHELGIIFSLLLHIIFSLFLQGFFLLFI